MRNFTTIVKIVKTGSEVTGLATVIVEYMATLKDVVTSSTMSENEKIGRMVLDDGITLSTLLTCLGME